MYHDDWQKQIARDEESLNNKVQHALAIGRSFAESGSVGTFHAEIDRYGHIVVDLKVTHARDTQTSHDPSPVPRTQIRQLDGSLPIASPVRILDTTCHPSSS